MHSSILVELKKTVFLAFALVLLSSAMFGRLVIPVEASETIYIKADGSIEPSTANITTADNVTYYFTDNNYDEIVVERNNITIDGAGYTLQGMGSGIGIDLNGRSDISLKNVEIAAFKMGIHLHQSSNISISGNNIIENDYGIDLGWSSYQAIFGNNITNNRTGIWLDYSSNNSISGNYVTGDSSGVSIQVSSDNSVSGNTIVANGKGIAILQGGSNSVSGNTIIARENGIELSYSSSNNVCGNNITKTTPGWFAIVLARSSNNIIIGNILVSNTYCVGLWDNSDSNIITGNTITASKNVTYPYPLISTGITFHWSSHNSITENTLTNNDYGIYLGSHSSDNKFYHNNFINNTNQVYIPYSGYANFWDYGYPSGGNYWSDYTGEDANGDGIGDAPYVIDEDNADNYPLMSPWSPKAPAVVPFWMQWWFWAIVTAGIAVSVVAVYFLKKRKSPTPTAPLLPSEGTDTPG
jgi:parallel beta-helix repeat protein